MLENLMKRTTVTLPRELWKTSSRSPRQRIRPRPSSRPSRTASSAKNWRPSRIWRAGKMVADGQSLKNEDPKRSSPSPPGAHRYPDLAKLFPQSRSDLSGGQCAHGCRTGLLSGPDRGRAVGGGGDRRGNQGSAGFNPDLSPAREAPGAWVEAARLAFRLRRRGKGLSLRDAYVAFMAQTHGVLLYTPNERCGKLRGPWPWS